MLIILVTAHKMVLVLPSKILTTHSLVGKTDM